MNIVGELNKEIIECNELCKFHILENSPFKMYGSFVYEAHIMLSSICREIDDSKVIMASFIVKGEKGLTLGEVDVAELTQVHGTEDFIFFLRGKFTRDGELVRQCFSLDVKDIHKFDFHKEENALLIVMKD